MIKSVKIKNYTIIDELEISFENGFNVITGETGAGKSVIIDAIDIVLGAKTSKEVIKTGESKAFLEVEIELPHKLIKKINDEYELELDDDTIFISREISETSSRIRVNGVLISQNILLELRKLILDVHSQHQTYTYLQPKTHINLLDNFGDDEHCSLIEKYKNLWKDYQKKLLELKKTKELAEKSLQEKEFLEFQIKEIQSAAIEDVNEFDNLVAKVDMLSNIQELKTASYQGFMALLEDDNNLTDGIDKVKTLIEKASRSDERLKNITQSLTATIFDLRDTARELRSYYESLDCDESALDEIQQRLDVLSKIKRKYGGDLTSVLNNLEDYERKYNLIENSQECISKLENEIADIKIELENIASAISTNRHNLAENISDEVTKAVKNLEMPYAQFKVDIKEQDLGVNGKDEVEFFIVTNPTEPFKPLAKIASGGEISRVMLAIKTIFANSDDILTVIFDEIDTGISGKTSQAIAECMKNLAKTHQIICITHQPIIVAVANAHFHVTKEQTENEFNVNVAKLEQEEKIKVIAKMLSGDETQNSIELARDLINRLNLSIS